MEDLLKDFEGLEYQRSSPRPRTGIPRNVVYSAKMIRKKRTSYGGSARMTANAGSCWPSSSRH
jgi:hypothetical protein